MNVSELQAELRHFAAERDWQPFHTPKNLSTALMVEAAELAEIFQWMTPEESRAAHEDAESKVRIGEEVADVLLYLLQIADHSRIDIEQAVKDKLARNALKYPAKQAVARVSPARASVPGTHVLLDFENVQPTEDELRAMVPDASQVWVFHGSHQRQVEQRFAFFRCRCDGGADQQDREECAGLSLVLLHGLHRLAEPGVGDGRGGERQGLRADAGAREGVGVCGASAGAWAGQAFRVGEGRFSREGRCGR